LPLQGRGGETRCDVEWFFGSVTLSGARSDEIADVIVQRGHRELAKVGYESVVTGLGTEAIAQFMSMRHRYLPAPLGDDEDRWIRSLRTGPASVNSVKRRWKSEEGQYARNASEDVAKNEIIIDLTMLMERAPAPSAMTLQLGDGLHCRSSEGPFGVNL